MAACDALANCGASLRRSLHRTDSGDAVVFDCRGLDQKGKPLELRLPPANRRAFPTHDALRRSGLKFAFYPYPYPLDNMICWPVSVRIDNV